MRMTFLKYILIICSITPLFTYADLEIPTLSGNFESNFPKHTHVKDDQTSHKFWYYKFLTGNPGKSFPLPGFGIGKRTLLGSKGYDISFSIVGKKKNDYQFLLPKIAYLRLLGATQNTQYYGSFGLAWGGCDDFLGIIAHAGLGLNFNQNKNFVDITIYLPALSIYKNYDIYTPNLEFSFGTGF